MHSNPFKQWLSLTLSVGGALALLGLVLLTLKPAEAAASEGGHLQSLVRASGTILGKEALLKPGAQLATEAASATALLTPYQGGSLYSTYYDPEMDEDYLYTLLFDGFTDASSLDLNGDATTVSSNGRKVLRLTSLDNWESGSAFVKTPIPLSFNDQPLSFSSYFRFQILDGGPAEDGADGLVFVLAPSETYLGAAGIGIGYQSITPSLGIEFDTHQNGSPANDPNGNHIGLNLGGNIQSIATAIVSASMENEAVWYAWVDYDGQTKQLEVRLSLSPIRPVNPNLSYTLTQTLAALIQSPEAYIGFTSGTGLKFAKHDILFWSAAIGLELPDPMWWNAAPECPFCHVQQAGGQAGGPINTRNGNLSYQETDLSMPVLGGNLAFQRAYASDSIAYYTTTLGYGWTHNYDMRLHFANTHLTETVELQAPGGSLLPFFCSDDCSQADETYTPYPGVTASLSRITATSPITTQYIITGFNQMTYTFNFRGWLLRQSDPFGNVITFTYDNEAGTLERASQGSRFLDYEYEDGRLIEVQDNLERTVSLSYDGNDNLVSVVKPLELTSHYFYSATNPHLLTEVIDPSGRTVEKTAYDDQDRAYQQWDGLGNLLVEINYVVTGTHVVTENGVVMTHTYDARGTLVDTRFACTSSTTGCGQAQNSYYDRNFRIAGRIDANGNPPTRLSWDETGSNVEQVVDALSFTTTLRYDSHNNLTQTSNAQGYTTTYGYHNVQFPTFRTHITDTLDNRTIYTPTASGLLQAELDPENRLTTYAYNAFGQITQTVRAAGTPNAITTTYGYDGVGRLITMTQTSAMESHTSLNVYDAGDRLIATLDNWTGNDPDEWQDDCDTGGGPRDTDICTQYLYDAAGRVISTTNTLDQTNLTFYDSAGRVVTSVVNYNGASIATLCTSFTNPNPEYNLCSLTAYDQFGRVVTTTDSLGRQTVNQYNALGRVSKTIVNYQNGVFNDNDPDADLITSYEYDAAGNTLLVTDTLGHATRTFYDALNRVEGTIVNWTGPSITLSNCLSQPLHRDENICTRYQYDAVGNTIIVTDTMGIASRTFYNQLNQVIATVQNWKPTLDDPSDCVLSPNNTALANICTLYGYNEAGQPITTTNALNQRTLTVYDKVNRPFLTVANWNGATIDDPGDCDFTPAPPYVNLCTLTTYDLLGRRSQVQNTLGLTTTFTYDGLGRALTTTQYLDGAPVATGTRYDALGNRLNQIDAEGRVMTYTYDSLNRLESTISAEGVEMTQFYDAASRVLTTTDGLSHSTSYTYDDLDRLLTTTDAEDNTTSYTYDALGNQKTMTDAENNHTHYDYDDLNRLIQVTENPIFIGFPDPNEANLITRYTYDVIGNRVVITNARTYSSSLTTYDALNRPVIVEDALGQRSTTAYNALGYRTVFTDANGELTHYAYDGLNRTTLITYTTDAQTVRFGYNALGHRTIMTDSLGTTHYSYDDLYRLITVTNPFTGTLGYGYDLVGNRTGLTYPDGKIVTYTYDLDNRLIAVEDWDDGLTTYSYDPAGRLITTTLPNGVVSVNSYDDANRLVELEHTHSLSDTLIARYQYQLDGVGNRVAATETLLTPTSLTSTLTLSPPITVTAVVSDQQEAATAYNNTDQEYIVAWRSRVNSTNAGDIYARLLDDSGATIGSAFAVVTTTKTEQDPSAAYSPDAGTYLITWSGPPLTSSAANIYGRLVNSNGQLAGNAFIIDNSGSNSRSSAETIYDPDGNQFLVVWVRRTGSDQDLYAAFVNASTGAVGTPFAVANDDSPGVNAEFVPALATDSQGTFLAVWQRDTGSNQDILGQLFDDSGLVGGVITITNDSDGQDNPAVTFDQTSQRYLVSWEDDRSGDWELYGQFLETDGDLAGGNFELVPSNSHVDPQDPAEAPLDNHYLVGFDRASNAYLSLVHSSGVVLTETVLSDASGNQRAVALASDANDNALAVWESNHGTQGYDIYAKVITANLATSILQTTTITYTYDPLYRLTFARYTGAIAATYLYRYDPVGNMIAYTQTITSTTAVTRSFDRANQLQTSLDLDVGTTSYYYDGNGNLEQMILPGSPTEKLYYEYDQRNLLVETARQIGLGPIVPTTQFSYDGATNRLQQIDLTGSTPITTTYTNDILGLSQVLVAQQGANQVHNLFGLDLIHQNTASQTLTLLADGLGSVRLELLATAVVASTTYDPYGNRLAASGSSGTEYGFTGEQEDSATGLLYLRARYYHPSLNQFQSRDPFPGYATLPASQNGFSYVGNNPINYVDPSGLRRCTPQEAALDFETCDDNISSSTSLPTDLFNFEIIPGTPGGGISKYIMVTYRDRPWGEYVSSAPANPVLIPVRHPLNLLEEKNCETREEVLAHYASGSFSMWEVNARNIIQEISGVITSQTEWALRDAIGIAYVPYNRVEFHKLPGEQRHGAYGETDATFSGYSGRNDPLGLLLGGDNQFAGLATSGYKAAFQGLYGDAVYHFSLVVAYGVDQRYFRDTSYGATNYHHRPEECSVTGTYYSYTFFKNQRNIYWNRKDRIFTTAELAAQGGWPAWARDDVWDNWFYDNWITGYPPLGCRS